MSGKAGTAAMADSAGEASNHIQGKARIDVGLIALGEESSRVLDDCRGRLENFFTTTFPDFVWAVERENWEGEWGDSLRLLDSAQSRMEEAGWQFCFLVLDREPQGSDRPGQGVVSFSHSAAAIYLPLLLSDTGPDDHETKAARCCGLILSYFARLNGLPRLEEGGLKPLHADLGGLFNQVEVKELNSSLHSMTDGLLRRGVKEVKGLALYLRVLFLYPTRVIRAVFSHHPLRMVFSLGKLVFAAMGALVLSLLSAELWQLGVGINIWRLVLIALAALLASTLYVVFQQRLFVRRVSLSLSEQAVFFNLTSFLTVFCVFIALFLIIFAITVLVTVGIYPRYIVKEWLQKSQIGLSDYVRVSLLISSLAMVVGALGAGLEENQHFRQVMYTERNR